jgi:aspartyl-tRNA(Asn)/glutamyl-tRNA(Gln) amidotransferase subunit A
MQLYELSLAQASKMLRDKEISSVELTQAHLERISSTEPKVKAFISVTPDEALAQAQAADKRLAQGDAPMLCGIPGSIKDVICTKGVRSTAGSKILKNFVPPYDAHLVGLLKEAGMVILGKTNMDEFAMGSSCEHSAFFPTHNPWKRGYIPGGSSGGSAACVAARSAIFSVGTDTGGSIRQPASHCGVVGLKPTYGRVSRRGVIAFASSLDQAGPFARSVEDVSYVMSVLAGHDPKDSTSAPQEVPDYQAALDKGVKGMKLGVPREYFIEGLDPQVESLVREAIDQLDKLGATVQEVSLPHTEYVVPVYYIIAPAEASSNLARYQGVKYSTSVRKNGGSLIDMYVDTRTQNFGPEVIRRIMLGTYALSAGYYEAYYGKAGQVRTLIKQDYLNAFEQVDAIVCPIAPTPAFKIGEVADDPLQMYLSDIFTLGINLTGIPGLSVPCGRTKEGLPVGLQILAPHFGEERLLTIGQAYQGVTSYHLQAPEL